VFVRFREETAGTYHFDIVISDVDGRNVRRVAAPAEFASAPAWSPDGRQIMFATPAGLYVVNADGSALTRITMPPANAFDGTPTWR
jgi:Tol biopolymer transport system component